MKYEVCDITELLNYIVLIIMFTFVNQCDSDLLRIWTLKPVLGHVRWDPVLVSTYLPSLSCGFAGLIHPLLTIQGCCQAGCELNFILTRLVQMVPLLDVFA